jgi:hypothetical protein
MAIRKKPIDQTIRTRTEDLKKVLQSLGMMKRLADKKVKPAARSARMAAAAPAPAGQRAKVVEQLIGLLHSEGVNSPNITPASTYNGPQIGFSNGRMQSYCQTCRAWFHCPGMATQSVTITVNQMATAVIGAGGQPR